MAHRPPDHHLSSLTGLRPSPSASPVALAHTLHSWAQPSAFPAAKGCEDVVVSRGAHVQSGGSVLPPTCWIPGCRDLRVWGLGGWQEVWRQRLCVLGPVSTGHGAPQGEWVSGGQSCPSPPDTRGPWAPSNEAGQRPTHGGSTCPEPGLQAFPARGAPAASSPHAPHKTEYPKTLGLRPAPPA